MDYGVVMVFVHTHNFLIGPEVCPVDPLLMFSKCYQFFWCFGYQEGVLEKLGKHWLPEKTFKNSTVVSLVFYEFYVIFFLNTVGNTNKVPFTSIQMGQQYKKNLQGTILFRGKIYFRGNLGEPTLESVYWCCFKLHDLFCSLLNVWERDRGAYVNQRVMQSGAIAAQVLHDHIHALSLINTFEHF